MRLIYSATVSLDGFIADAAGQIDWSAPDEELHRFHNQQMSGVGVQLLGRRLYETMVYWETVEQDPAVSDVAREFAGIWKAVPKVVFSRTLESVVGNTSLANNSPGELVANAISSSSRARILPWAVLGWRR